MASVTPGQGLSIRLSYGDEKGIRHTLEGRTETGAFLRLTCSCGAHGEVAPQHEVIWYALHLAAPDLNAAELAGIYQHAVQSIAQATL